MTSYIYKLNNFCELSIIFWKKNNFGRKGSLRNSPISEETYRNQYVATGDDQLQSLK